MATIPPSELVALLIATSFAAGLNVYATLVTLGLLAHAGILPLPPALHLVSNWYVIAASGVMFAIEFFADKIPAFDLLWNALHTFIRIPIAALLAYGATSTLSPGEQLAATVVGGAIALAAHGGKTADPRCRNPIAGTVLEHNAKSRRRWSRHLPDLVRDSTSVCGDSYRVYIASHHRCAGTLGGALTAEAFPRSQI